MTALAVAAQLALLSRLLAQNGQLDFIVIPQAQAIPLQAAPAAAKAPSDKPAAKVSESPLASELAVNLRTERLDGRLTTIGTEFGSVEPSAEGLQLLVQKGATKRAATGVTMPLRLQGDFEVTVAYDQLGVRNTSPGRGAGVSVTVVAPGDQPGEQVRAALHRVFSHQTNERHYLAERIVERSGSQQTMEHPTPAGTSSSRGARLRIARRGGELYYSVCEDRSNNFTELHHVPFPTSEVTGLELAVHNGNLGAEAKVRLVDLMVRAAKMGGAGPVVTTINNELIPGTPAAIENGSLVIQAESQRTIPLDEVLSINLDRSSTADAATPAAAAGENASPEVMLHSLSGDRLTGGLIDASADTVRIRSPWGADVEIPLLQLSGIEFVAGTRAPASAQPSTDVPAVTPSEGKNASAAAAAKSSPTTSVASSPASVSATPQPAEAASDPTVDSAATQWQRALERPGETDTVLVRARDGALTSVSGSVQAIRSGKLELLYEGQARSIDVSRLIGIVCAAHPGERPDRKPIQRFHLLGGQRIAGHWLAINADSYEIETPWNARWQIPASIVREITSHNGRMVYLSDLEPAAVEQVPYFGRVRPFQKDSGFTSESLRAASETFAKGFAVHSRTVLNFAIEGAFANFRATVGFDPAAGQRGRVACRVLGDGKELFADADLRANEPPAILDLPVAGVSALVLEIDFGEAEDAGDDVVWGNPRLYRETPAPAAESAPAASGN